MTKDNNIYYDYKTGSTTELQVIGTAEGVAGNIIIPATITVTSEDDITPGTYPVTKIKSLGATTDGSTYIDNTNITGITFGNSITALETNWYTYSPNLVAIYYKGTADTWMSITGKESLPTRSDFKKYLVHANVLPTGSKLIKANGSTDAVVKYANCDIAGNQIDKTYAKLTDLINAVSAATGKTITYNETTGEWTIPS